MSAIHIDVTELLANGLHTGIQRVVRQIAQNGMAANPGGLVPMIAVDGRFHVLNQSGITMLCAAPGASTGSRLTEGGLATRLIKAVLGGVPSLYDWAQTHYFRRKLDDRLVGKFEPMPVAFQSGDRVVLLDSFWGGSTTLAAAREAHAQGASVVAVVYDMIPVTHARFASAQLARSFAPAILEAAKVCAGFVTISKYCQGEIANFLQERGLTLPVSNFYLGADLVRDAGLDRRVVTFPIEVGEGRGRLYIMVGTIEPRKSHAVVIDAFERLWQQGRQDRLLIIGKVGWDVDPLMTRLNAHPELGHRLFLMHDASDTMLDQAFDAADAAIMASSVEGFGLPLVESLYRNLPVIASDIPVFREIAGDAALYFTLDDAANLARAIIAMERDAALFRAAAIRFKWINWNQAVTLFLTAIDDVTRRYAPASAD